MAKALLGQFSISGDVIDRVATIEPVCLDASLVVSVPPSAGTQAESPLAGQDEVPSVLPENELQFERDGLFQVFTIGATTYRLGGVKPLFVTSLRVNVRATSNGAGGA